MRRKHVITAGALARELEVSERTVYRDIRDLVISGVPIDGEAGVGYTLRKGFDLPPLMFSEAELKVLMLGARVVTSWGDAAMAKSAKEMLARVEAALPERLRTKLTGTPLFAPGFHVRPGVVEGLALFRAAIDVHRKVWFAYGDGDGAQSERAIRPLGLFFWGYSWSVTGWCELRDDFRNFRLDRMSAVQTLDTVFPDETGKTLDDYFAQIDNVEDRGAL